MGAGQFFPIPSIRTARISFPPARSKACKIALRYNSLNQFPNFEGEFLPAGAVATEHSPIEAQPGVMPAYHRVRGATCKIRAVSERK